LEVSEGVKIKRPTKLPSPNSGLQRNWGKKIMKILRGGKSSAGEQMIRVYLKFGV
jgi:hypothetical protein